jgi:hypothetical protein
MTPARPSSPCPTTSAPSRRRSCGCGRPGGRSRCSWSPDRRLPASLDSHRDAQVRRALAPLSKMAERLDIAAVTVARLTKDETKRLIQRVSGSGGFVDSARSVLAFVRDPDDPESEQGNQRILVHVAANWARLAPSPRFGSRRARSTSTTAAAPTACIAPSTLFQWLSDGEAEDAPPAPSRVDVPTAPSPLSPLRSAHVVVRGKPSDSISSRGLLTVRAAADGGHDAIAALGAQLARVLGPHPPTIRHR